MTEAAHDEFSLKKSEIQIATGAFRRDAMAHITEGSLAIRELNFYGVSQGIPVDESAIKALCFGPDGRIFGATAGRRAHLFAYDPHPVADHIIDLGIIGEEREVCPNLVCLPSGRIVGGGQTTGILFSYDGHEDYSLLWKCEHNRIEIHEQPFHATSIHALCISSFDQCIYGLAFPAGALFRCEPDSLRAEQKAELDPNHLSRVLVQDKDGRLWGTQRNGELFYYDPSEQKLEQPGLRLPGGKGMDFLSEWDAAATDSDGIIYGGTTAGFCFALDTRVPCLRSFGKPIASSRIRALSFGKDGYVYGLAGHSNEVTHLFRLHPSSGEVRDLGIPHVSFPKIWTGYKFDAMLCGEYGQLYLGESDRISHLFIYYPPVARS
jgi:hypothetical protein